MPPYGDFHRFDHLFLRRLFFLSVLYHFLRVVADLREDIHVSSFYEKEEPDYNNEIARIFRRFPQLNVSEVARSMGIHKSLLSKYIYGIKRPSEQRKEQIIQSLHLLGKELLAV